ncbi:MAG: alpha/beta hydrolase [Coriobacteriia bacterium]|nr:alpha/beta hydrolase [Coriobacteriia bacterium]
MPYFENQGARLYYEESGQGDGPLVFLHGLSLDGRQWARQVERFSSQYRVITLDARGHGKSSLPPGKVDNNLYWQDVVALLDHLGISRATLCGNSMGGHVAIQVAINAAERVDGLILIGAICTNSFNRYERWVGPINRFCCRLMPISWIAWSISVGMGSYNRADRPYIKEAVKGMGYSGFNRSWKAVNTMESRGGLPQISCPALLLIGEDDSMTGRQQPYMLEHIAGSRLVTIPRAHHATNLDNPEQVEQEIEAFLQGQ